MSQKVRSSRTLPLGGVLLVVGGMLTACGGGGSPSTGNATVSSPVTAGSTPTSADFVVTAGEPVLIPGAVHTDLNLLKTIGWTAGVVGGSGTALVLSNDQCGVATKSDKPIIGSTNGSTGSSDWSCSLGVATPPDITRDTYYSIGLNATDDKSKPYGQTFMLRVVPNQQYLASNAYNAAGPDFVVKSGGTANLNCSGPAQTSYQWVVVDSSGYNITLANTNSASTGFTAPAVRTSTPIRLACRMTDSKNRVTSSNVTVNVQPPTIVAGTEAGQNFTVRSGQAAPLYCQGPSTSNYSWTVLSNAGYPIQIANYKAQQTLFLTPAGLTAEATNFVFKCSVGDTSNIVTESTVTVTVVPVSKDSTAAGVAFSVKPGQTAPLFCTGNPSNKFQWAVTKNPAGIAIALSSYSAQQSSFVAPSSTSDAQVTLTCTESQANQVVNQSSVVVTVKGEVETASVNSLVAKIAGPTTGNPGNALTYTAASGWFDDKGVASSGGVITNTWTLGSGASAGFALSNTTGASTTLFVPSHLTTAVSVPLTLTSTSGTSTSAATLSVLVDPASNGFVPTINPAAQTEQSGKAVTLTVSGGTNQMFYQWTIVSGPVVPLGGDTTATVGFVAPTVTAPTTIKLRAAIGYAPITVSNPGTYFVEGVVTVTP